MTTGGGGGGGEAGGEAGGDVPLFVGAPVVVPLGFGDGWVAATGTDGPPGSPAEQPMAMPRPARSASDVSGRRRMHALLQTSVHRERRAVRAFATRSRPELHAAPGAR